MEFDYDYETANKASKNISGGRKDLEKADMDVLLDRIESAIAYSFRVLDGDSSGVFVRSYETGKEYRVSVEAVD